MRKIDPEVLLGFVDEARSYLPKILDSLETALGDPARLDSLEAVHRLSHTIKGAASMVGLAPLSHMAYYVEEAVEQIGAGQLSFDRPALEMLRETVSLIERYLDGIVSGDLEEQLILAQTVNLHRRLRGLPENGDEAEFDSLTPPTHETPVAVMPPPPAAREPALALPDGTPERVAPLEEISPELRETFLQETEDHLQGIHAWLRDIERQPGDREGLQQVRRSVHTLKGAASMVGFTTLSQLAHRMEDLLDGLSESVAGPDAATLDLLFATVDAFTDLTDEDTDLVALRRTLDELYGRYTTLLGEPPFAAVEQAETPPVPVLEPLDQEPLLDLAETAVSAPAREAPSPTKVRPAEGRTAPSRVVRVPIERLDELVRLVSELVVHRSTFEQSHRRFAREVEELGLSMARLGRLANRLETKYEVLTLAGNAERPVMAEVGSGRGPVAAQPEAMGFDELELDRYTEFHLLSHEVSETSSDITEVASELGSSVRDFESYLTRMGRLTSEVQDKLMQLRMAPLASLASRLHRTVRVTARQQGKAVDLVIDGEATKLDKKVLIAVADPLLHILRNAVDHGIEPPALRQAVGKPERGSVRLSAYYEGTQVVLCVGDDGAGLLPERLRAAAVEGGFLSDADAARLRDDEVFSLIFLPGFSTASEVSEVSGRGVGLDVVKENVQHLEGTIEVSSATGQGTTFIIRLPMTLAITRVLLIETRGQTYAMPLAAVHQILRIERGELENLGREAVIRVEGDVHPVLDLGDTLGLEEAVDEAPDRQPVLMMNLGGHRLALLADRIIEAREVVVKTLGSLLQRVEGVVGATLMGDGSVVLILNPNDLLAQVKGKPVESREAAGQPLRVSAERQHKRLDIMVVDDSVSVRRVISNLLTHNGWNPITAKDGLEALEMIQSRVTPPDVLLLDIEMPRMDGYELTSILRGQASYASIPIVMLTSRAGEKHRQRAFEVGVTEYLVKPYQDETLLNVIRRLVRERRSTTS